MSETTAAHFDEFKRQSDKWLGHLGLRDWEISYSHKKLKKRYSEVSYNFRSRKALISLSTQFDCAVTRNGLEEHALHEVLHLAFSDLASFAESAAALSRVEEAEHAVVHRLKRALLNRDSDQTKTRNGKR